MRLLSSGDFVQTWETWLTDIGLDGDFGKIFLAIVLIVGITVALSLLKLPRMVVLFSAVLGFLVFTTFGWFPLWTVIVIVIAIFGLFILKLRGGTQ